MIRFEWDFFRISLHHCWNLKGLKEFNLFRIIYGWGFLEIVICNFGIGFEWDF